MANPFRLRTLEPGQPFCDREKELADLERHARNNAAVVLFSPRRYGKTSLAQLLQAGLDRRDVITVRASFFGVSSIDNLAAILAKGVYESLHRHESLLEKGRRYLEVFSAFRPVFKPSRTGDGVTMTVEPSRGSTGPALLEETLEDLGGFIAKGAGKRRAHIVLDEFQEIVRLRENLAVEGLLREHIQSHEAAYLFIGSRRSVLLSMFDDRQRAFYQSALKYSLGPLPYEDATHFVVEQFRAGGKECPPDLAAAMVEQVRGYPFYIQAWAYHAFDLARETLDETAMAAGLEELLASERYGYEAILQMLPASAGRLLKILAVSPTSEIFSADFLTRNGLSIGNVQSGRDKLVEEDLIEQDETGTWLVTDPVFGLWLERNVEA